MPEIVLLVIRYVAIAMLVLSVLLMIARWKYPQNQEKSPSAIERWREVWRLYRKSRDRERERSLDIRAVRRKSVLIVDPDEKSARVLVWRLEGMGCTVFRARNGTLGLSAANGSHGYQIVIADALLPDISAVEFYDRLPTGLPVLYVGVLDNQRDELKQLGPNIACLRKPFDTEKAVELAGRLIRHRSLTKSSSRGEKASQI